MPNTVGQNVLDKTMRDGKTVRQFLKDCLVALIEEGENFSAKRPLGNSDWEEQLCLALGAFDMCGYGELEPEYDYQRMRTLLLAAIAELK